MGRLFLARLQQEGRLQRGDEVQVDGKPGIVAQIVSASEIIVDHSNGWRTTVKNIMFGSVVTIQSA